MGQGGKSVQNHVKLRASALKPKGDYSKKVLENAALRKKHQLHYTAGDRPKSIQRKTKPEDVTGEAVYVGLGHLDQLPFEHPQAVRR